LVHSHVSWPLLDSRRSGAAPVRLVFARALADSRKVG
jgi:hypothetical protein